MSMARSAAEGNGVAADRCATANGGIVVGRPENVSGCPAESRRRCHGGRCDGADRGGAVPALLKTTRTLVPLRPVCTTAQRLVGEVREGRPEGLTRGGVTGGVAGAAAPTGARHERRGPWWPWQRRRLRPADEPRGPGRHPKAGGRLRPYVEASARGGAEDQRHAALRQILSSGPSGLQFCVEAPKSA
jgi:hypothetical protein